MYFFYFLRHWDIPTLYNNLSSLPLHNIAIMWKSRTCVFVCLLSLFQTGRANRIHTVITHLEHVYDYILKNHRMVNIDCIFGVVLSQGSF